jgi:hypothetical protein
VRLGKQDGATTPSEASPALADGQRRALARRLGRGARVATGALLGRPLLVQVALTLLVALCWLPVVAILTARETVLAPAFYTGNLDRVDAYDRLYSQVLPDPAVDDLLGGLPVDRTLVTANVRTVLPPSTVRGLTDQQITRIVGYLRGDVDDPRLTVDLSPLFSNITGLANRYLAGQIGQASTFRVTNVSDFTNDLLTDLDQIAAGRPPQSLPTMPLSKLDADRVLAVVLRRLDGRTRAQVAIPAETLLREGDVAGALALLGPPLFRGDQAAIAAMRARLTHGTELDLGVSLADLRDRRTVRAISQLHGLSPALPALAAACAVAMLGGLVGAALAATAAGRSAVRAAGYAALTAGVASLVMGVVLRLVLPNPLTALSGPGSTVPKGAVGVLTDFGARAYGEIERDYVLLAVFALVVGVVVVAFSWLPALAVRLRGTQVRQWRWAAATALVAIPTVVTVTWAAFPGSASDSRLVCEGSRSLCDRRYDQVTYAATHNAMANSEDQFLGPDQDPSIVHQLDLGVRALLIDVHHWTTPAQVSKVLDGLPPATRAAIAPLVVGADSARPGLWLCHDLCQLGATDFVAQLRAVGDWLDRNPGEVVTLDIQDEAPAREIIAAVEAAGLTRRVLTPPADPRGSWPTLRSMIDSGRRLVVFTESQDTPGTFLRSLYRYASDTPFDARRPSDLAGCALERGSPNAPMLLVNHWTTTVAPSRRDALVDNTPGVLVARARVCERLRHRAPTFLAVDFATIGDVVGAVDILNGVVPDTSV